MTEGMCLKNSGGRVSAAWAKGEGGRPVNALSATRPGLLSASAKRMDV